MTDLRFVQSIAVAFVLWVVAESAPAEPKVVAGPLNCKVTVRFHKSLGQEFADGIRAELEPFSDPDIYGIEIQFESGLSDIDPQVFVDGVTTIYAFNNNSYGPEVIFTDGRKANGFGTVTAASMAINYAHMFVDLDGNPPLGDIANRHRLKVIAGQVFDRIWLNGQPGPLDMGTSPGAVANMMKVCAPRKPSHAGIVLKFDPFRNCAANDIPNRFDPHCAGQCAFDPGLKDNDHACGTPCLEDPSRPSHDPLCPSRTPLISTAMPDWVDIFIQPGGDPDQTFRVDGPVDPDSVPIDSTFVVAPYWNGLSDDDVQENLDALGATPAISSIFECDFPGLDHSFRMPVTFGPGPTELGAYGPGPSGRAGAAYRGSEPATWHQVYPRGIVRFPERDLDGSGLWPREQTNPISTYCQIEFQAGLNVPHDRDRTNVFDSSYFFNTGTVSNSLKLSMPDIAERRRLMRVWGWTQQQAMGAEFLTGWGWVPGPRRNIFAGAWAQDTLVFPPTEPPESLRLIAWPVPIYDPWKEIVFPPAPPLFRRFYLDIGRIELEGIFLADDPRSILKSVPTLHRVESVNADRHASIRNTGLPYLGTIIDKFDVEITPDVEALWPGDYFTVNRSQTAREPAVSFLDSDAESPSMDFWQLASGAFESSLSFLGRAYRAARPVIPGDVDGDGAHDFAALATHRDTGAIVAQVRSADGARIKNVNFLGPAFRARRVTGIGDLNGNGVNEIVVLATRESDDAMLVQVRDALTAENIGNTYFLGTRFMPMDMAAVPDLDDDGVAEIAVLAVNADNHRFLVQTRNPFGPRNPKTVWFLNDDYWPLALRVLDDTDGNGIPELAVLAQKFDGKFLVQLRNAAGPANPRNIFFMDDSFVPGFIEILPDADGDGSPDIAVAAWRRASDRRIRVQVRNAAGAPAPRDFWFHGENHQPITLLGVPDDSVEGGLRIGVLAESDETGKRYMQLRNAIGPQRPFTYEMPPGGVAAN